MNEFYTRTGNDKYQITFETDIRTNYQKVQSFCRQIIDGENTEAIPVEWIEKKIAEKKEKFVGMCDELTPVFVMYEQVLKDWREENG